MWTFERGEGAPAEGVAFRIAHGRGFGRWLGAADFFAHFPARDALIEALAVEYASDAEMAWSLIQNAIGRRTRREGQPDYACIEVALNGRAVLTANGNIEWHSRQPEGDSAPYVSPISFEADAPAFKLALKTALKALKKEHR